MIPDFAILADSQDITDTIRSRLLRLRITDEAGTRADTCEMTLDDRDNRIAWPRHGAILQISLGYQGRVLSLMGAYIVDEVAHNGPPNTMTIRAKAADMIASLKAPKTRAWEQQSLGQIVDHIAREHSLTPRVSEALDQIVMPHIDQTEESDLHFLTRLARQYDAVAKLSNGFLLFVVKGEAKSASGQPLTAIALNQAQILRHRLTQADRGKYVAVRTFWQDVTAAERIPVVTGEGEPIYTLRESFADATQAADAGRATLNTLQRGEATLSLTVVGNVSIQAEAPLSVNGLRDPIAGQWLIKRAEHQLDGSQGFITQLDAEVLSA